MYSVGVSWVLVVVIILWLGILSYFFATEIKVLNRLFTKSKSNDLRERLNELFEELEKTNNHQKLLDKKITGIIKDSLSYTQNVAMIRYNPYGDTGGNMSFSLAMLDGRADGFVLTSLHTRNGTRIYTKMISKGKSELELSKEEVKVIEKALNGSN